MEVLDDEYYGSLARSAVGNLSSSLNTEPGLTVRFEPVFADPPAPATAARAARARRRRHVGGEVVVEHARSALTTAA